MNNYILDADRNPVKCDNILEWGRWFESSDRRTVAMTDFDGGYVSTVFLGMDHNFQSTGKPILWETMIFGGPHDGYQERYTSHEDAVRGHEEAMRLATYIGGEEDCCMIRHANATPPWTCDCTCHQVPPAPVPKKIYLTDGAYAEFDGESIILTAENGIEVTQRVVLDATAVRMLERFIQEIG